MNRQIRVYISDDCPECEQLIEFLEGSKVAYQLKNVSEEKENLKELHKENMYVTPAVIINQHYRILGFQKDKIAQLLGI